MALAALTRQARSTSRLQTDPIFSLSTSIALLSGSKPRIRLSKATPKHDDYRGMYCIAVAGHRLAAARLRASASHSRCAAAIDRLSILKVTRHEVVVADLSHLE